MIIAGIAVVLVTAVGALLVDGFIQMIKRLP